MKNKNYIILVIGQIISLFGSSIQRFSLSLYLLDITGSPVIFANILAFSMMPYVVFAPIAGFVADRFNRKNVMVVLDLSSGFIVTTYAIFLLQGKDHYIMVAVVMILLSITSALYGPAVTASIPQVVSKNKLVQANGIVQQISSMSNLLGPILAGVCYGLWGIRVIIIINAISFFFSAFLEMFMHIPSIHKTKSNIKSSPIHVIYQETTETYGFLKRDNPIILRMILIAGLYNLFLVPIFSIGAPYIIKITLNMSSQVYGLSEGFIALGMILGGFMISMRPKLITIERIYYVLFPTCISLLLMALALMIPTEDYVFRWFSLIAFTLGGSSIMLALGISNVISASYVQQAIPLNMMGKISAFSTAFATICIPLGQIIFGQFIEISQGKMGGILLGAMAVNFGATLLVKWNVNQIKELQPDLS